MLILSAYDKSCLSPSQYNRSRAAPTADSLGKENAVLSSVGYLSTKNLCNVSELDKLGLFAFLLDG